MTKARSVTAVANPQAEGPAAGPGIARWLALAATPTFALMALLTAVLGGKSAEVFCSAGPLCPLNGMVLMYLLMSAFHAPPWLRLIARR